MKKQTLLSLFAAGTFLLAAIFTGCPSPTVTPEPPAPAPKEYITITYDAGEKGTFENGESTITQQVEKGKAFTLKTPTVTLSDIYTFKNYTIDDTSNAYAAGATFTKNTTLKAQYAVISPTNLVITKNAHATQVSLTWEHPSDSVTYKLKITDLTQTNPDPLQMLTADTKNTSFSLTHSHEYKIEVCAEYVSELSAYIEGTVNMVGFFTVTYDAGTKGNFNGQQTIEVQVDEVAEGTTYFTADKFPSINNTYVNILEFDKYTIDDTGTKIEANHELTKDITLKANYTVIAPTNLTLTKKNEEATIITVQIEHPSDQNIFTIEVTDAADSSSKQTITESGKTKDVTGLEYSHTYNVTVWAVCEGDSSEKIGDSLPMFTYYTVTYDAGDKGTFEGNKKTISVQADRGILFNADKIPTIKDNYNNIYEFANYTINNTSTVLTSNYQLTGNITLKAAYNLIPPKALTVTGDTNGMLISFEHDSDSPSLRFKILIENQTHPNQAPITVTQSAKTYTTSKISFGDTYSVKVSTLYNSDESTIKSESYTVNTKLPIPVLFLMYMDGDNNLNDDIFFDLNEAEYGLAKAGTDADKVKIITLFDGGPRQGDGYENAFGFTETKLLELGPQNGEIYSTQQGQLYITPEGQLLSNNTIDRSSEADWLSTGEVDMSDKQTLLNFLTWATERYDADSIILQFSNHGGGPRSYMPKEVILPNGEKIKLHDTYGRRSMCWDDTTGGSEYFLKTSDLSYVFDELGFGTSKSKIKMIIEDVCLGGSIEEAYEIKNYADYLLASPNTIPGFGMDYVNLVNTLCAKATTSGLYDTNAELFAKSVITKYKADYAESNSFWCDMVKQYLGLNVSSLQEFYNKCEEMYGSENASSAFNYYLYTLSTLADVSTLSLIKLSNLDTVVSTLNNAVQEFLVYADTNCTNYFYDADSGRIVNQASETTVPIKLKDVFVSEVLLPGDAIYYQGTYSWLHDLGYVLDVMNTIANNEGLTNLKSKSSLARTALTLVIKQAWRDGWGLDTYSTLSSGEDSWLGTQPVYQYGLTISGEALKTELQADGKYHVVNGYYPTWYTDLKFGQDCKWNDLLQACFPNQ